MPFVPVVSFWSTRDSISLADIREVLARGTLPGFGGGGRTAVPAEDADALAATLGIEIGPLVVEVTTDELRANARAGGMSFMRVTDVDQSVHALAIDDVSLFGNERVTDLAEWPLRAPVESGELWDPSATWTLVAGGDVMLDRGVAKVVRIDGLGGDYLFDGGTARVTGTTCCSDEGFEYPTTERTGNGGLVRRLFGEADVAIANLESAVLVDAPYHPTGYTFTADASLLDSIDAAGFDFMSLANNHIRNAGELGIRTAMEELDRRGIAHSGAGLDQEAGEAGYVEVGDLRVAFIGCDAIRPDWTARDDRVGTLNCKNSDVARRIRAVRATADVVIVFPHWGLEYRQRLLDHQRPLAAEWMEAGADMIIGAHTHVAGGMEEVDGNVVFYAIGNLIFDLDRRQSTMMGVIPEMTFSGTELVQIVLHPTLIIDAQPNLVAPDEGGQFVLDQMRESSEGLLGY